MNFTCFSSSDPAARNASVLYDSKYDEKNLWNSSLPLAPCSSSSSPPAASHCLVCLERTVTAVCRNLEAGAKLIMEAGSQEVQISESECPKLWSDGDSAPSSDYALLWMFVLTIPILAIIFVICKKYRRNPNEESGNEVQEGREEDVMMLTHLPVLQVQTFLQ